MWVPAATHWRISTGSHYSWIGRLDPHHRLCSLQGMLQHSLSFKKWSEFLYRSETSQPWKSGLLWLENNFRTGGPTQQLRCSLRKIAFSVSPCLDWLRPSFLIVRILRGVAMAPSQAETCLSSLILDRLHSSPNHGGDWVGNPRKGVHSSCSSNE